MHKQKNAKKMESKRGEEHTENMPKMEDWERRSDGHHSILQYLLIIMFQLF